MDISDKVSQVSFQANSPKLEAKTSKGNLPEVDFGTNFAQVTSADPTNAAQTENNAAQLEVAVAQINEYVQNNQRTLEFSVDEESGRDVVRVLDRQTDEVIRQIPSEEVLAIARNIDEYTEGNISLFTSEA